MGTFKGPFTANGPVVGGFYGADGYLAGTVRGDQIEAMQIARRVAEALNRADGLSVELSALRHDGGGYAVADPNDSDLAAFGVYIRNPLAFHVRDFRIDNETGGYGPADDAKAAAFTYADGLADHLGCSVDTRLTRPQSEADKRAEAYRAGLQADGVRLTKANGFGEEIGGGGCTILSRYYPNGAYIWATNEDGPGEPSLNEFCVCVYAQDDGGQVSEPLIDLRQTTDDGLGLQDALRMAMNAARFVDERIGSGFVREDTLADIAGDAARAAAEPVEIVPDGFRRWTEGVTQAFAVYVREGVGCVILSDMFGQSYATAESWSLGVFTGTFCFEFGEDTDDVLQPVHTIEMESGAPLDAAIAAAIATLNALPAAK